MSEATAQTLPKPPEVSASPEVPHPHHLSEEQSLRRKALVQGVMEAVGFDQPNDREEFASLTSFEERMDWLHDKLGAATPGETRSLLVFLATHDQPEIAESSLTAMEQSLQAPEGQVVTQQNVSDALKEYFAANPHLAEKYDRSVIPATEKKSPTEVATPPSPRESPPTPQPGKADTEPAIAQNCPKCGAPLPDGASQCGHCGTNVLVNRRTGEVVSLSCPNCGAPIAADARECGHCHAGLVRSEAGESGTERRQPGEVLTTEERLAINNHLAKLVTELRILEQKPLYMFAAIAHEAAPTPIGDEMRLSVLGMLSSARIDERAYKPDSLIARTISAIPNGLWMDKHAATQRFRQLQQEIPRQPKMSGSGSSIPFSESPTAMLLSDSGVSPLVLEESMRHGGSAYDLVRQHVTNQEELGTKLRAAVGESAVAMIAAPTSAAALGGFARAEKPLTPDSPPPPVSQQDMRRSLELVTKHPHHPDFEKYMTYMHVGMLAFGLVQQFFAEADPSTRHGQQGGH